MDATLIATTVSTGLGVTGFVYMFFRNFKQDINSHMGKFEERINERINGLEKRMDSFEHTMRALDERMFYLSTGRSLADAILSQKSKETQV